MNALTTIRTARTRQDYRNRYWAVRVVQIVFYVLAGLDCIFIIGSFAGVMAALAAVTFTQDTPWIITAGPAIACGIVAAMFLFFAVVKVAVGQILQIAMDIEKNTRR